MSAPRPTGGAADVTAYRVPPPPWPVDLRLDGNEGSWPDAALLEALRDRVPELLHAYPSAAELERLLADRHGVDPAAVLVTAGADEALDRLFRAYLDSERNVVLPEPTFVMLRRYAALAGAAVRSVAWPSGAFPCRAVIDQIDPATGIVAVVSPNNPTGAVATPQDLAQVAAAAQGALVVVDAAYAEFAADDLTEPALRLGNAVVTRTFSKAWGLAGARVGYVVGPPAVTAVLRGAASPYSVSGPSLAFAAARLQTGAAAMRSFVSRVRVEVGELRGLLAELTGAMPPPSAANFVLADHPDPSWLRRGLAALGIAVRTFPGDPALASKVRITCPGDAGKLERLAAALRTVLRPQAILLDMDGVLADVSGSYRQAILATAARFGVAAGEADIDRAHAAGDANDDWQLTWRLVQRAGGRASLSAVTATFEALYQGTAAAPGLWQRESLLVQPAILQHWRSRFRLGVVTGRPRRDAERFLAHHRIAGLFDAVVCREDAALKPDPAPVRVALARLGVDAAWMLGDTPDDCRAARAAGVLPIATSPPRAAAPDQLRAALTAAGAVAVIDRPDHLDRLLP